MENLPEMLIPRGGDAVPKEKTLRNRGSAPDSLRLFPGAELWSAVNKTRSLAGGVGNRYFEADDAGSNPAAIARYDRVV